MKAYYYDNLPGDYTLDHDSGKYLTKEELLKVGVIYHYCETIEQVDQIAKEREYKNRDEITISPTSFGSPEALKEKLDTFYAEHIHEDEEIRFVLDGEGFFDVRSAQDEWIRVKMFKGDLLILPAGIYHRFTLSSSKYIKAMRLFKDEPKWIALNRPVENNVYREEYLKTISV